MAFGPGAARNREALKSAVRPAATRYRLAHARSAADLDDTARLPRHAGGEAVVRAAESGLAATGVPAFVVDTAHPTTIGLGDTFVGGFLAAVPPASRAATAAALERALDGVVSAG